MPIRFVCPVCWAVRDEINDDLVGKLIKCQDCHAMSVAQHTPPPNASAAQKNARPQQARTSEPMIPPPLPHAWPVPQGSSQTAIVFSTGDVPGPYEMVDIVFAHGSSLDGAMKGMTPVQAFQLLVNWLGQTAVQIGGNAVIHLRFEFRPHMVGHELSIGKQSFEVYGYGTAVKLHEPRP
jgi:uncharacterized protein YbjQ (UPF0145 family)